MLPSDVTFRNAVIDENAPADKRVEREIIEIKYPGGTAAAFPATDIDTETGLRWCDRYGMKYKAFKDGDPDPDRVSELESKIAGHQAELDALHAAKKDRKKSDLGATLGFQPKPTAAAIGAPSNIGQGQQAASNPQYATAGSPAGGPARPGDSSGPAFVSSPAPTPTPPDLRVDHGLGGPAYIPPPARNQVEKAPV